MMKRPSPQQREREANRLTYPDCSCSMLSASSSYCSAMFKSC
jgi:hypothetical protein